MRALAPEPPLLGAAEALRPLPGRAFATSAWSLEDVKAASIDAD